ncbi:hypothetical protein [Streptomyces sp. NPDC059409]|uniref:hypothetical protein n=1 Tax=Streptomyces sp. NPDC059409 TaxID=3346824 RepID=UPI0036AA0135
MAHAVPTPGTPTGTRTRTGGGPGRGTPGRPTPDVLGEKTHLLMKWGMPVATALVYGYWVASVRRHGGPITGTNLLFGFMSALAFVILYFLIRSVGRRLPPEPHAALWGAFAGSALGFIYSGSGVAMFTAILASLLLAGAVTGSLVYHYYTHRDAEEARAAHLAASSRTTRPADTSRTARTA